MIWKKKKVGKIFISYRRSDTQGYAGRLSDSLESYFGGNRIFRDIKDIKGGADYAKDIEEQMSSADAVIVLIGPKWLSASNDEGKRRIDDSDDWVVQEIITAIELGIRVFPVLIDGTVLPRKDELPSKLAPILNFNAITISDRNWEQDILGLGKIISFDVPTTNEKILFRIQVLIYTLLSLSLVISTAFVALNAINQVNNKQVLKELISLPIAAIPFYVLVGSLIILSLILRLIDKEKQKYIVYSLITGSVLSAFFFFGIVYIKNSLDPMIESMFVFFGSILTSTIMFTFLGLSGFKPK
ncbi:TIR domain-containing protein [Psychroserpens sp.]|uniref:TIR domain-containing protein n=1 Tax=Psychroserpens sp. TaxID=2020870 RepID=UPI002B26B8F8|nr:TIR domain-containing protein [Psychroserpens sp.]